MVTVISAEAGCRQSRTRLLRENCTVMVFSGLPVEQAEFHNTYE